MAIACSLCVHNSTEADARRALILEQGAIVELDCNTLGYDEIALCHKTLIAA